MKKKYIRPTKYDTALTEPCKVTEKWHDPLASVGKKQRREALARENEELLAKLRRRLASEE